jgi:hypothetical protein
MRLAFVALLGLVAIGCGNSSETNDMMAAMDLAVHVPADLSVKPADMVQIGDGGAQPLLVVNNTIAWCTVIVTINGVPTTFSSGSMSFMAPAGTTVGLQADPNPTFMPVKWTGVTTMNGDMATYLMTSTPTQSITACCAESNGSGC